MKRIIIAVLLCTFLFSLSAMDFGLDINNSTTLNGQSSEDLSVNQENSAILWLSLPIGSDSSLYVSGVYKFSGNFVIKPSSSSTVRPYSITAGRIEWEGFKALGDNSSLYWSMGRINFSDYSGKIVNSMLDGGKATYSIGNIQLSSALAYTGLTFKDDARVLIDQDDADRNSSTGEGWPESFANQRLVASLGSRFVEILPMHDFGLELWAQFDMEPEGVKTHTQYIEPFIDGRFGRHFRWRLWFNTELGQEDEKLFYSMAAGGRARWTFPEINNLGISASINWAGGGSEGAEGMRPFSPINTGSMATIAPFSFSDAMALALDASIVPFRSLNSALNFAMALAPGKEVVYQGSEVSLRLAWKPLNDLSVNLTGGAFFPNAETGDENTEWMLSLKAALKL